MKGIRIGTRIVTRAVAQGALQGPYGIAKDSNGMRPSALEVQVRDVNGASAHSVTVEGAMDTSGPWQVLATIADQLNNKVTNIPDYVRFNPGSVTGGQVDIIATGAVN
jgi:hypothetical protein